MKKHEICKFECKISSSAKMIKYADDVTLLIPFQRGDSVAGFVDSEARHMKEWCTKNGLALNENKTKTLIFSRQRVDEDLKY